MSSVRSPGREAGARGMDARVAAVAARQHGVFARAQAIEAGATESAIRWRLRTGRWERVHAKVFRTAGAPRTWRQQAMAACLQHDAVLSHRSAAALAGMIVPPRRIEVTVPRSRNPARSRGVTLSRSALDPDEITVIDAIPTTVAARTLVDLGAEAPERVVARCLDAALRDRLVTLDGLERWLDRRERRRGSPLLRRLMAGRVESPLERRVLRLLRDAGLPAPALQHEVRLPGGALARLDMAYPEHAVAIEADGFRFHDRREGFDRERARGNELVALGWSVLRVTDAHLRRDPDAVVAWVRRALTQRPVTGHAGSVPVVVRRDRFPRA